MAISSPEPALRKERKISHLTLFFPVTAKIGTIGIYRLDASGLHLIRVLHGCEVHWSHCHVD